MHADFSAAAKNAREQIPVPSFNFNAIQERLQQRSIHARLRRLVLACGIGLGLIGGSIALATNAPGVRVWLFGNKTAIEIASFAMTKEPTAADLRRITGSATFPVILPAGLPQGAHIWWIAYSPADHPTFITIVYRTASGPVLGPSLIDSRTIETDRSLLASTPGVLTGEGYRWQTRGETVIIPKAGNSPSLVNRVRGIHAGGYARKQPGI